mmetsp:Transcript_14749/g.18241  ORF Transcript_14749/g.18241 Transcript_14749/m.18241 type:complete len:129 (-) Transcript_14749:38-424(-)
MSMSQDIRPSIFSTALFGVAGIINFAPLIGIVSPTRLSKLYGLPLEQADSNLLLLLRHRAALFGIVGGIILYAAFHVPSRSLATVAGFSSMLSFMALAISTKSLNRHLTRVLWVDVIGCLSLATAQIV